MASTHARTVHTSLQLVEGSFSEDERFVAAAQSSRLRGGDERKAWREHGTAFVTNRAIHFVGHRLLDALPAVAHVTFDFQNITNWHAELAEDRTGATIAFDHELTGAEAFVVSGSFANAVQGQLNAFAS